ncbi:hypothetical protein [Arsenicicoccus dermatophilus]|uniref:hypothetical protein n=1 Tax=Arsenicicoccus dermatophilus TaxID=1076331 RepID=UPI003916E975
MSKKSKAPKQPAVTPVYAAVGAADLAIEQLKKTLAQVETLAETIRTDLEERIAKANEEAHDAAVRAGRVAHGAPEQVLNQGLTVASLASHAYTEMTQRGQRVVGRGVAEIREDRRVRAAAERAEATVKVAASVRGLADKTRGHDKDTAAVTVKDTAAVTVKGAVVEGEGAQTAPVKNVRAVAKDDKAETPRPPRKRTAKRATTIEDVETTPATASKRPSRASVAGKATAMRSATTIADLEEGAQADTPAVTRAARAPRRPRTAGADASSATTGTSRGQVEAPDVEAAAP